LTKVNPETSLILTNEAIDSLLNVCILVRDQDGRVNSKPRKGYASSKERSRGNTMIDSIGGSTNLPSVQRAPSSLQAARPRSAALLTAVQRVEGLSSDATAPTRVFAVPQTGKSGPTSMPRLPRGSLVDVLV
jgi:hypothetical protein